MNINNLGDGGKSRRGRWGQARRLEFIDARLYWDGRLNRSDLADFFGISVQQASLDLAEYLQCAPGNVVYDLSQKAYLATEGFQPILTDPSSARYLAELYALTTNLLAADMSFLGAPPPADIVRHPTRLVPVSVLRPTLTAIREKRALRINYQAMSRTEPNVRVIAPHALGYDGYRWHIRAYCHERQDYRDFVFARILALELLGASSGTPTNDDAWERIIDIVIAPNPSLLPGPRRAIELDYGMTDSCLVIKSRQALAFYLLKRLGLVAPPVNGQEQVQQIVLLNREELMQSLPRLRAVTQPRGSPSDA